jgi:hypothetical protein
MNYLELKDIINERYLKRNLFQGTVVDNQDPLQANRIKVALDGITDQIDKKYLPWYVIARPPFNGSNAQNDIPKIDSRVLVYFEEEDIMNGKVVESISSIPPNSSV